MPGKNILRRLSHSFSPQLSPKLSVSHRFERHVVKETSDTHYPLTVAHFTASVTCTLESDRMGQEIHRINALLPKSLSCIASDDDIHQLTSLLTQLQAYIHTKMDLYPSSQEFLKFFYTRLNSSILQLLSHCLNGKILKINSQIDLNQKTLERCEELLSSSPDTHTKKFSSYIIKVTQGDGPSELLSSLKENKGKLISLERETLKVLQSYCADIKTDFRKSVMAKFVAILNDLKLVVTLLSEDLSEVDFIRKFNELSLTCGFLAANDFKEKLLKEIEFDDQVSQAQMDITDMKICLWSQYATLLAQEISSMSNHLGKASDNLLKLSLYYRDALSI